MSQEQQQQAPPPASPPPTSAPPGAFGLGHNAVKQISENSSPRVLGELGPRYPLHFNNGQVVFNNFPTEKELKRHIRDMDVLAALERIRHGPITWDSVTDEFSARINSRDEALAGYHGWKMNSLTTNTFVELEKPAEKDPEKARNWLKRKLHL